MAGGTTGNTTLTKVINASFAFGSPQRAAWEKFQSEEQLTEEDKRWIELSWNMVGQVFRQISGVYV